MKFLIVLCGVILFGQPIGDIPVGRRKQIAGYLEIQLGKSYDQILALFASGAYQGLMLEPDRQFLRMSPEVTPKFKKRLSLLPASTVLPCAFRSVIVRFQEDSNTVERIECLLDNRYVSYLLAKQNLRRSYGAAVLVDKSTSVWVDARGNSLLLKRAGPTILYQMPSPVEASESSDPKDPLNLILQVLQSL